MPTEDIVLRAPLLLEAAQIGFGPFHNLIEQIPEPPRVSPARVMNILPSLE